MELARTAAIVTGGASGIGAATAAMLAKRGASVFVLDLADSHQTGIGNPGVTY